MRSFAHALLVTSALAGVAAAEARPPELPKADYTVIEPCSYPDDKAARAAWKPMRGTADVSVVQVSGRNILRMPCNLAGTDIARASWDRTVRLDLSACRGIQFRFFCTDISPVSHFSVFLKSGDGWYTASFTPTTRTAWNTVALDKSKIRIDTGTRGKPAGLGTIDTIRISAWRGQDKDTEFYIADIGLLGADAEIVVVSADSVARKSPRKAGSIRRFTAILMRFLDELGVPYIVMSDLDVTARRLEGKKVAMLPIDHRLPDTVETELTRFITGGGKVILFFGTPAKFHPLIGIKAGAYVPQKYPGHFSSMRFPPGSLVGAPRFAGQQSWNIREAVPVRGQSRVLAWWYDVKGKPTGHAAVVASDNCIQMTHVLLGDDPVNQRRMLLAFLGRFMPELWEKAAETGIRRIGDVAGYPSFQHACANIRKAAGRKKEALAQLDSARSLREEAIALSKASKYPKAIDAASQAHTALLNAYCSVQTSLPGEFRAFWTHEMLGIPGWGWDKSIKVLAENGFTAIIPNLVRAGTAYYQSDVLPVAPQVKEHGDQIAKCLAACKKHGLQMHVWKVNYNMAGWAPQEFTDRMRKEARMQVSSKGVANPTWLCPSHPANQKLEIDSMLEIMTKYHVDGIHFDYIRYPDGNHCFCQGCREQFEKAHGVRAGNWPADVLRGGPLRRKWLEFRRDNITRVVAVVSKRAREIKPGIKISAAVFSHWTSARDNNGQDWKLWCDRGYLDFVCPMDYTASDVTFENLVARQIKWAGKVPCYPGIGLLKFGARVDQAISQIKITRRYRTGGFIIWQYALSQRADTLVPLLGRGITAR